MYITENDLQLSGVIRGRKSNTFGPRGAGAC